MLKTTTLLITKRLGCTKPNKNQLNKNNNDSVSGDKIDKKIANLSNNTKKMSSEVDFPTFKARLTFTLLKKAFIKALILYYYNLEHYIQMKINVLRYTISEILAQLTFEISLAGQVIYKSNN